MFEFYLILIFVLISKFYNYELENKKFKEKLTGRLNIKSLNTTKLKFNVLYVLILK